MKQMNERWSRWAEKAAKYKYVLLVLMVGLILLLLPERAASQQTAEPTVTGSPAGEEYGTYSLEREENRLAQLLSGIDGAGDCQVLLAVASTETVELAQDDGETVILSGGSGRESTVTVKTVYPEYLGAVVVSGGANDPAVKYELLSAVMSYTGLRSDQISICTKRA